MAIIHDREEYQNAATNPHFGPLLTADEGQLDKTLDANLKEVFRICQAVAPHIEAQGGGKIINIVSVVGIGSGKPVLVSCLYWEEMTYGRIPGANYRGSLTGDHTADCEEL